MFILCQLHIDGALKVRKKRRRKNMTKQNENETTYKLKVDYWKVILNRWDWTLRSLQILSERFYTVQYETFNWCQNDNAKLIYGKHANVHTCMLRRNLEKKVTQKARQVLVQILTFYDLFKTYTKIVWRNVVSRSIV